MSEPRLVSAGEAVSVLFQVGAGPTITQPNVARCRYASADMPR